MRFELNERVLNRLLAILLIFLGALLIISIPGQPCHVDEAWMGEQAYHESRDGVARQELLFGMYHFEVRMLIRHKLFIFLGDIVTRLFGFHLPVLRMISLVSGLLAGWMMYHYTLLRFGNRPLVFHLSAVILLLCPIAFRYVKIYRPEFLVAALGFASFFLVVRALERRSALAAVLAGVAAGLATLAHLNGIIFITAGFVTLLVFRRFREASAFLAVSVMVCSIYFTDIVGNFTLFREQFFNTFVIEKQDTGVFAPFLRLLSEHKRYFRTPEIIGISVLFFVLLPLALKKGAREERVFYLYLLLLFISLPLVAKSITTKYAIPLLPFLALAAGSAIAAVVRGEVHVNRMYGAALACVWVLYAGYGLYYATANALQHKSFLASENALIARSMERGSRVLAPARFIFNEIGNYEVRDLFAARYLITRASGTPFNLTSLCEYARDRGIRYMVIDPQYRASARIDPGKVFPPVLGYEVVKIYTNGTLLLKEYKQSWIRQNQ